MLVAGVVREMGHTPPPCSAGYILLLVVHVLQMHTPHALESLRQSCLQKLSRPLPLLSLLLLLAVSWGRESPHLYQWSIAVHLNNTLLLPLPFFLMKAVESIFRKQSTREPPTEWETLSTSLQGIVHMSAIML